MEHGCLFLECSARTRENVEQCFEELALKVSKKRSISRGKEQDKSLLSWMTINMLISLYIPVYI